MSEPDPRRPVREPAGRMRGWREEVMSVSALNVLAGIWLIISPWVLGYTGADATWNPVVFGAIVAILALVRATGAVRADGAAVINMLIGVWLFISAFWLADSGQASWNVGIMGVIVFLLAAWSLSAGREAAGRGPAL